MAPVLSALALALEMVGAAIIVATAATTLVLLGANLVRRAAPVAPARRRALGRGLILGLEFLIGADILKTIVAPTLQDLAVLAAVIVLGTILSLSIEFELRHGEPESRDSHA